MPIAAAWECVPRMAHLFMPNGSGMPNLSLGVTKLNRTDKPVYGGKEIHSFGSIFHVREHDDLELEGIPFTRLWDSAMFAHSADEPARVLAQNWSHCGVELINAHYSHHNAHVGRRLDRPHSLAGVIAQSSTSRLELDRLIGFYNVPLAPTKGTRFTREWRNSDASWRVFVLSTCRLPGCNLGAGENPASLTTNFHQTSPGADRAELPSVAA